MNLINFYTSLNDRWKQLLEGPLSKKGNESQKGVSSLTTICTQILLNHPVSCQSIPTLPCSLIKKVLPNGMTLAIQERQNPKAKVPVASIRLVVKAGCLHEEDEDQLGLAHLVEHGIFQGTENFTREEIESLYRSLGCGPEADANASTGFNVTTYKLDNISMEEGKKEEWNKCLQLFYEYCTSVKFPTAYMLKERDVVLDELLKRKGMDDEELVDEYNTCFPGNRHNHRMPGILAEAIQTANAEELQSMLFKFYRQWYQPQNMIFIVVGDFGDSLIEVKKRNQLIEELVDLFGSIPASEISKSSLNSDPTLDEKLWVVAPWQKELRTSAFTHAGYDLDGLALFRRTKKMTNIPHFSKTMKRSIQDKAFQHVLYMRLHRASLQPDSPLTEWTHDRHSIEYTDSFLELFSFCAIPNQAQAALKLVVREFKRLEKYGTDSSNLATYIKLAQRTTLNSLLHYPTTGFSTIIENYSDAFIKPFSLTLEPLHYVGTLILLDRIKSKVLSDKVKKLAQKYCNFDQQDVILRLRCPTSQSEALDRISEIKESLNDSHLYDDLEDSQIVSVADTWLSEFTNSIVPVPAIERDHLPEINTSTWTFPNEIKALFKPISLGSSVYIEFIGFCGSNQFHPEKAHLLIFAFMALNIIGFKDKSLDETKDFRMLHSIAGINTQAGSKNWNLTIVLQDPKELETALQLLHLRLTDMSPIFHEEFANVLNSLIEKNKSSMQNILATENGKMRLAQQEVLWENQPQAKMMTLEDLEKMSVEKARELVIEVLKDISKSKVLICGNLNAEVVEPLLEKYIGSLPVGKPIGRNELTMPFTSNLKKILYGGQVPDRSSTQLFVPTQRPQTPRDELLYGLTNDIFKDYLNTKIRMEEQQTYGLNTSFMDSPYSPDLSYVSLALSAQTEALESLSKEVWDTLETLLRLPTSEVASLLEDKRLEMKNKLANQQDSLVYWCLNLSSFLKKDYDPATLGLYESWIAAFETKDIEETLRIFLARRSEYKEITMHPTKCDEELSGDGVITS